ncbi:hypothetical protein B0T16DRAFT_385969 [Cercophora newfieldiana]|uniref:Uncharacterized protein n=1 Tax=Cercophora newfieldiana TaxID=92897 RepID=A0AA39YRU0_9PEZI|nr:hypothetical protein B0T16DRAFT_385969 [Cercophora newfieldiana]
MKWAFAISLLTTTAMATPVPAPDVDAYRLRVISNEKAIGGEVLRVSNGKVGVFKSVEAPELAVYVAPAARSDQVILHSYPAGASDNVLALIGENNLLTLSTVEDPSVKGLRPNSTIDWSFSMDRRAPPAAEGSRDTSKDLLYTARSGKWIAMPQGNAGDWVMMFRAAGDGYTVTIDMPAKIVYERIEW